MSPRRSAKVGLGLFVLAGLAVALVIGVVVSNFAASSPDALQRAVIDAECEDAADTEACLVAAEGEPAVVTAPGALAGYEVGWFSGLVGVIAAFTLGTSLMLLVRRLGGGQGRAGGSSPVDGDRVR